MLTFAAPQAMAADAPEQVAAPGDIVVTASRRAERLQDVPIAVSAIGAAQIKSGGFQQLTDIQYQVSGVQFGNSPNDAGFRLRGVGTAGGYSSSSEQNVGTVVDGVVIPFGNPVGSLGDLERVEALKGPQGTQFGKNASSGVINITTAKPKFGVLSGKVFASYGELNEVNTNASVNIPVSANSALAVYAYYRSNDGFVNNVVRHEKWGGTINSGVRAKYFYEPSDDLSFYLIGDYSRNVGRGPGQLWTINSLPNSYGTAAGALATARFANLASLGVTPGLTNDKSVENSAGYNSEQNYGGSLEINKKLGNYNLTSITAYRGFVQGAAAYAIDATSYSIFTAREMPKPQSFISEELRLSSASGSKLEFIGGIYASSRKVGSPNFYSAAQLRPALPFATTTINISAGKTNTQTKSDSVAGFVDGKYHVTEQFALIGGFRYQYDWVKSSSVTTLDEQYMPGTVVDGGFVVPYTARPMSTGSVSKGGWSGKAGANYKINRDVMLFGTIARGYLGPTVTFSGLTGTRSDVNPQTVRDIALGIKSQLFNRAVTFNASVFFDQYKNLQTSVFNGTEFLTQNAGGFNANGFEFDANWRVSPEFSLRGGMTYSETKFTDYETACPAVVKAAYTCYTKNGTSLVQAAGEPLSGAPKVSATFGADVKVPINDRLNFDWSANFYYRSRVQYDVASAVSSQPGYYTIGLNTGVGDAEGKWRVGVFARNLLDKRFVASVIGMPFADAGATVNWLTREGRRTVGVSATMSF
ncbi:TonB-dependent receptor [Novosphingobium umbonatum]|uniref:TonB-dependent receptor n=2 Tax=Novosphingobium umbonatum TaxID=1908524 RepID=A0A3S2UR66_9SPHN|nr:TonB-dependent receptor [Novosphingobium umbonatum]